MRKQIIFTVRENNALYKLPLGNTLTHFIESDFTYFREQCIEVANKYQNSGEYSLERASVLKEYIRGCHPYCSVLISTQFSQVVMDCMIDYLCVSTGIGLEELWVKTLSAADKFGQAVFRRISEYKSGHAINQWTNLLRMQTYAAAKTEFLFAGEAVSSAEYEARKLYFDMAFMLSAQELGCNVRDLPQVKRYSVPLLPGSTSMLKNAVNTISPIVKSTSGGHKAKLPVKGRECLHDQTAGVAFPAITNLQRPMLPEIRQLMKAYGNLPSEVYEPSSFKAILDLEFDKLIEYGLAIQKSSVTGEYHVITLSAQTAPIETMNEPQTEPVSGSDIKVAMIADELSGTDDTASAPEQEFREEISVPTKEPAPVSIPEAAAEIPPVPEETVTESRVVTAPKEKAPPPMPEGMERVSVIREMSERPDRSVSKIRTLKDINMRCNQIWNDMHARIGSDMTEEENREWFKVLIEIRRSIGNGDMLPADLDKFLDATEEVYGISSGD